MPIKYEVFMGNQFTTIKYCNWCGDPFEVKSPNQKYCSPGNKNCSHEAKRESWRKAASKYRKNYKDTLLISQMYKLGSGFLGSSAEKDFNQEYKSIQKEKKRLKLNSILFGLCIYIELGCQHLIRNLFQRGTISYVESNPGILIILLIIVFAIIVGLYWR
ncbi:hypothetical protein [Methanobacterium alcaliphilum]|uniref:hypothetical protein n=1 Tax=Methanobacterium alcaliphilum TaxID=392018 RepID=UPI00200A4936|nr:hypothetical protein [Methanobacterium alcaliphilum]MCK9150509.1 hypothetical protein [Methanobacterium alcaliphilum]